MFAGFFFTFLIVAEEIGRRRQLKEMWNQYHDDVEKIQRRRKDG